MNRKVLALAITALLAANAANAAEIYNKDGNKIHLTGKVEADYKFRDKAAAEYNYADNKVSDGKGEKIHNEDNTFARLGFMGETQINSQLTGYATFEHEFSQGDAAINNSDDTRYAFVGLKYANLGSLDFGRNYGVVGIIRDFTDNAPVFGGEGFNGERSTDVFMLGRASSLATYTNEDLFGYVPGLTTYLQYQAKNSKNENVWDQHGDGFAFATTYTHEATGLSAGFTYANSDRVDDTQVNLADQGKHAEIWGIATKYDANNIYAAISWAQTNNMIPVRDRAGDIHEFADKTRGLEAIFNYTFDFGNNSSFTPSIVYNQTRGRDLVGSPDVNNDLTNAYLTKYVGLGAKYQFNKNIETAVGYKINLVDEKAAYTQGDANIAVDDQVEMRLTYSF
ncbi:porin [Thorsellia anophelis]|uniref:Outer membrane porin protein LC n=1 Tax=Thorsellia anophelis DSM 18579 TaxID=1123402 RepID=A0A1I0BAK1_9GAMM|nr:porin [Thorsellia anophelis]SET03820.1 outer membrane porin protein LC [Thorsellia anophelis DSM 18579]